MKHLANCKPTEFLKQTNRARKYAADWLEKTDILNIRKIKPEIPEDATDEQKEKLIEEQVRENLDKILNAAMDKYPEETLELIALLCFVEPKDIDNHSISEYMTALDELRKDKAVWSFFISLVM